MTAFTTITRPPGARARNAVLAAILGASLAAAPPLGVPAAGSPLGAALAQAPAPCSLVQPCRLSTGLPPSYSPQYPILTADGDTVVFTHTADPGINRELYSVPVRGGAAPVRLDPPHAPPSGGKTITPDGQRVLYVSESAQGRALFSVPINGPASAAVRLSPAILGTPFLISPDSRLVTFQSPTWHVRAVPIAGPESRAVTLTRTPTDSFGVSSNSRNLVYIADGVDGESELLRVPLTLNPDPDQQPTRLSGPMVEGGGVHSFRLPVGDGPVVYSADQEAPNIRELYSVGFGGGNRTKLNVPGWKVGVKSDHLDGFQSGYGISNDGRRVVYEAQARLDPTQHGLFSVPTTGPASASRRLDVTTPNTWPPSVFHITADSRRVVYIVAERNNGPARAFSVPIDGPADTRVQVSAAGDDGDFVQISPDGQRVVSRMLLFNQDAVLSAPVDEAFPSPNLVRLNGAERLTGSVRFDPLSQRVAYTAQAVAGESDVFSSALGSQSRFNLTATLTADYITSLAVSDQHVVYAAQVSDDAFQLYSSRLIPGTPG